MFTETQLNQMKDYCQWYHQLCISYIDHGGRKPTEAEDDQFLAFLKVLRGEGLTDAGCGTDETG